jgi:hypothetical protein
MLDAKLYLNRDNLEAKLQITSTTEISWNWKYEISENANQVWQNYILPVLQIFPAVENAYEVFENANQVWQIYKLQVLQNFPAVENAVDKCLGDHMTIIFATESSDVSAETSHTKKKVL